MIRNTQLPRSATDTWQISGPENESWYRSSVKASIGLTPRIASLALSPRFHIQHYSEPLTTLAMSRLRRFGRKQLAHRSDQSRVSKSRLLDLCPARISTTSANATKECSAESRFYAPDTVATVQILIPRAAHSFEQVFTEEYPS